MGSPKKTFPLRFILAALVFVTLIAAGILVRNALRRPQEARYVFAVFPLYSSDYDKSTTGSIEQYLSEWFVKTNRYLTVPAAAVTEAASKLGAGITDFSEVEVARVLREVKADKGLYPVVKDEGDDIMLRFYVVDAASSRLERTFEKSNGEEGYLEDLVRWTFWEMAERYPLLGLVRHVKENRYFINLGTAHGVEAGSVLYTARYDTEKDDKGTVLFKRLLRTGRLKVTAAELNSSIAELMDPVSGEVIKANNLASPEPLPYAELRLADMPGAGNARKGNLIYREDFDQAGGVTVENSKGDTYGDGRLYLSALGNSTAARAYYKKQLPEEFILEGGMRFEATEYKYNKMSILLRQKGVYPQEDGYIFFWNNHGGVYLEKMKYGSFTFESEELSGKVNPAAENTFKIIAKEHVYDFYLNDSFVFSLNDEEYDSGYLGLRAPVDCKVSVGYIALYGLEGP